MNATLPKLLATGWCLLILAAATGQVFTQNKGQLHHNVSYRAEIPGGYLYFHEQGWRFSFAEEVPDFHSHEPHTTHEVIHKHALDVQLIGANPLRNITPSKPAPHYTNYLRGNDPADWVTQVKHYQTLDFSDVYQGIHLRWMENAGGLKYEFDVVPGADPEQIQLRYEGADGLTLKDGELHIQTSVTSYVELRPYAYQIIDETQVDVPCEFELKDNVLSFRLPDGYDPNRELVIDPSLIFSTFSGSLANNFGGVATYDQSGKLIAGGVAFNVPGAYPTTVGAYQDSFAGGDIDIVISKFNTDGSDLEFSTYIGGADNETPIALATDANDNVYLFGFSGSADFPVTNGAYDVSFAGGPAVTSQGGYGFALLNGCDFIISALSADGTSLNASTFWGGTGNDGQLLLDYLYYYYGDLARGQIAVDGNKVYVASTTGSSDIPVVNAAQGTSGGGNDAIIGCFDLALSAPSWSTYLGGSDNDAAFGLDVDNGNLYVTGGTRSANFPNMSNGLNTSFSGVCDGFVIQYDGSGNYGAGTYLGTPAVDRAYFVDVTDNNELLVTGHTAGSYPIQNAAYGSAGSTQFIHRLNLSLDSTIWSTAFGDTANIAPIAFGEGTCGEIIYTGWAGTVNMTPLGVPAPSYSSTQNLPVTPNAFQSTTDGSDVYIISFPGDMSQLMYGSFFGGANSLEHSDGGCGAIDDLGAIYMGTCAGCGGNSDWPSTPNAYSPINGASCNLGVAKFLMGPSIPPIVIAGSRCIGDTLNISAATVSGQTVEWDLGDGNQSLNTAINHAYADTGTYQVRLIVTDNTTACTVIDTSYATVDILPIPAVPTITMTDDTLWAPAGYASYEWFWDGNSVPGWNLNYIPLAWYGNGDYWVEVTAPGGCNAISAIYTHDDTGLSSILNSSGIEVFPNPAGSNFTVSFKEKVTGNRQLLLYDATGKSVFTQAIPAGSIQLNVDVGALSSGLYFITLEGEIDQPVYDRIPVIIQR